MCASFGEARRARCMIPSDGREQEHVAEVQQGGGHLGLPGMSGERVVVAGRGGLGLPRRGDHAGEDDDRAEDEGEGGDRAAEASGIVEHGRQATGGFVTRRRPARRLCVHRAGDARGHPARTDEAGGPRRYGGASVQPRPCAQRIDLAIAIPIAVLGVFEGLARENTTRWLVAALVNGAALALRRRSPLAGADRGRRRAGARARRDLQHRPALAVPRRADPAVHGRPRAATQARAGRPRDRARLRRGRLRLRPHRGVRPGRRAVRLLRARVGARARHAHPGGAARGRRAPGRAHAHGGGRRARADRARAPRRRRPQRVRDGAAGRRRPARAARRPDARARRARRHRGDRPPGGRRAAPDAGHPAQERFRRRAGAAAVAAARRRARAAGPRRGARRVADGGRRARRAAARARHVRLPDRAGGADERAALRARLARRRDGRLRARPAARGPRRRRPRERPRAARAPGAASSACASARRSSAASSRPGPEGKGFVVRARLPL